MTMQSTPSQATASTPVPTDRPTLHRADARTRLGCALAGAVVALTLLHAVSGGFIPTAQTTLVAAAAPAAR